MKIYEGKEEVKDENMIDMLAACLGRYMTRNLVAKYGSYINRSH
jgi:hypothetical protein